MVSEENIERFLALFVPRVRDEKLTALMMLQPEGRVNAEARLLAGEVQLERGNFDGAGKAEQADRLSARATRALPKLRRRLKIMGVT